MSEWRPHEPSREATFAWWHVTLVERAVALVRRPIRLCGRHTLEVFNADAKEQIPLHRLLSGVLQELYSMHDQCALLFHTRGESERLYADFVNTFPHACQFTVKVNFDGKQKYFCDLCGKAFR